MMKLVTLLEMASILFLGIRLVGVPCPLCLVADLLAWELWVE